MSLITSYAEESATKKSLRLEIPAESVAAATDEVARRLAKQVRLPGFRPGKVPLDLVKKRFAEELRGEVLEQLVQEAVSEAVKEKGLVPIGRPKVEELKFETGQPLSFRVDLEIRPEVKPTDYRGLKVPTDPVEATEDDVQKVLDRIREGHAAFEPIEGRPAADSDFALIDIEGSFPAGDGKDFRREKVLVEIGAEETLAELTANLRNAEPGMRTTFQKDYPADAPDSDFAGKTVLYTVELHALKRRVLPPLDDELARQALTPQEGEPPEGASLEMLRQKVTESVRRDKETALREKRRRAVLDGLLALHDVEAPESMVAAEVDSSLRDYARFLARQGVNLKEAQLDWGRLREEARPAAVRRVKEYLLLDAVGDAEGMEVSDTELDAELRRRARASGTPFSELKGALAKAEQLDGLREELRIEKVVEFLLQEAAPASLT